jgi:hypothetical protein
MWKQVVRSRSVEVLLDPLLAARRPLLLAAFNDASRLRKPNNLHKVRHVADEIVVDPLLIEDYDGGDLKRRSLLHG